MACWLRISRASLLTVSFTASRLTSISQSLECVYRVSISLHLSRNCVLLLTTAVLFDTNFKNVTAWFDIGTPPEPEYHNMKDAHVEAYTQMMFVGDDAVYLSVSPIVDKDKNRHPGFILPFGSKQEIEALITAIESLNPSVEEAYCIFCDVNLKTGEAHKQNCPYSQRPQQESVSAPQPMHDICITCPHCGATFVGKSASLFFNEHCKKDCPRFNQIIQVPQVPATPDLNKATKE